MAGVDEPPLADAQAAAGPQPQGLAQLPAPPAGPPALPGALPPEC